MHSIPLYQNINIMVDEPPIMLLVTSLDMRVEYLGHAEARVRSLLKKALFRCAQGLSLYADMNIDLQDPVFRPLSTLTGLSDLCICSGKVLCNLLLPEDIHHLSNLTNLATLELDAYPTDEIEVSKLTTSVTMEHGRPMDVTYTYLETISSVLMK